MNTFNCGWGFTKACNLKCKHCYNASGGIDFQTIPLEQCQKIVQNLKKNGVESINYGTGECGLAPEFWDLVQYVHSKGILQGLTTNGWSVNTQTINTIKECMNDVDVSIDYPYKDEHCQFRGHEYAWDFAINALNLLKGHGVSFSIVTCLHAQNCTEKIIDDFIKLINEYGCSWRINWFRPTGRGKEKEDLKLDPIIVYRIFRYVAQKLRILAIPDPYFSAMIGNSKSHCPCGSQSFRITPSGTVVPCVYFTKEMDGLSIINKDLNEIVNSDVFCTFRKRAPDFCKGCAYEHSCGGGCSSRAYLEYGSLNAPDPFCHKVNNIEENPFFDLRITYAPRNTKVHENYLCTIILEG
jgi:radical SAM protein with 4Fe4S-binding SPASM domain